MKSSRSEIRQAKRVLRRGYRWMLAWSPLCSRVFLRAMIRRRFPL